MLDASVPGPIRRCKRIELLVLVIWVAIAFIPGYLLWYGVNVLPAPRAYVVVVLLPMITFVLIARMPRNILRRAAAHDHLLCPDCTYDLRTLDATGTCPECGRAYEHEAVRAQWVDAARRLEHRKLRGPHDEPSA